MKLLQFIIKRLILMLFVLFGVVTAVFFISRVIPADPIAALVGDNVPQEKVDQLKEELGLNQPLGRQYFSYLAGVMRLDFGNSYKTKEPVFADIKRFFPATLELTLLAIFFAIVIGLFSGIQSAVGRNKGRDHLFRVISIMGVSVPIFWLAYLLLALFYFRLGWLPEGGRVSIYTTLPNITGLVLLDAILTGDFALFKEGLLHLLLPAFCLGYSTAAQLARVTRASMLDVLSQNYIRTAKTKGLSKRLVVGRHAVRNALIPAVTVLGISFGSLLSGAVLTETIFSWPGIGRWLVNSLLGFDYPSVSAGVLTIAFVYSIINLLVDISYGILDPRMRV